MNVEYVGTDEDIEDIKECASNIISTIKGTMPYMRSMGISPEVIGRSTIRSKAEYMDEVITELSKWDERISVKEIKMKDNGDGRIEPEVVMDGK